MPIWLAKRIFVAAEVLILAGAAAAGYWIWAMPARSIDPVVKAPEAEAIREASEGEPIFSEEVFVNHLETVHTQKKGINPPPPPPPPPLTGWQAEAKKHLKLKGVFVDDHPAGSLAAVTWKGKEELYSVAETIPDLDHVKVLTISSDNIEIGNKTGLLQVALTPSAENSGIKPDSSQPRPPPRAGDKKVEVNIIKHSAGRYSVPRRTIEPYLSRPERIWTEIQVRPQTDEQGNVTGYSLSMIKAESILHKMGLRAGDTITQVNGQGPINLVSILQRPGLKELKIDYLRAGRTQTVTCQIE